jgi:small subunit ribosomal protein S20
MQKFRMRLVSVTRHILPGRRLAATDCAPRLIRLATCPLVHSLAVANIKSQIKRNRQNERRRERNKAVRTELKTAAKKARTAVSEGSGEATTELLRSASRAIDKAASRGIVHKRAAARRKSRLAKAAGSPATSPEG